MSGQDQCALSDIQYCNPIPLKQTKREQVYSQSPVEVDHKRISKSLEAEAMLLPSGEKLTDNTPFECPVRCNPVTQMRYGDNLERRL
eukprot:gene23710-biopygen20344